MKKWSTIILVIGLLFSYCKINAQGNDRSIIRGVLNKDKTIHSSDIYSLSNLKGEDKAELGLFAIEYSEYNVPNKLIALQFELHIESNIPGETTAKASNFYYGYIDENEYPEVTVVITTIIDDLKSRLDKDKHGSISYITNDGICFGYIFTNEKELAFIELHENNIKVKAEFSNPLKFFEELHKQIDKATKKLYLPENVEKLKNVKKSKDEETKDVIIDDI